MGSAVVAEEVRALAQRSAEAARETAERIEDSIAKSQRGAGLCSRVEVSLQDIVEKVREMERHVAGIAGASREQSRGIDQINQAAAQMDRVTQSNAANAEESASAATELSAQVSGLYHAIESLEKLLGGAAHPHLVPAAKSPHPTGAAPTAPAAGSRVRV